MFRTVDLIKMSVKCANDKSKGKIKDVIVDIRNKKVVGFIVGCTCMFRRKNYIRASDVIKITKNMLVKKLTKPSGIIQNSVIDREIYNEDGTLMGNISEVFIDEKDYSLKAILITPGIVEKFIYGKMLVLSSDIYMKGQNIFCKKQGKIKMLSMFHEERKIK